MSLVTDEIENALKELSIPSDRFNLLEDADGQLVFEDLLANFVDGGDRKWWWEAFSQSDYSVDFADGQGFRAIGGLLSNIAESVWFVVEEDQLQYYPVYDAYPDDIQSVIGECYRFEYYIVPKNKEWLLCENHHNRMIGVGNSFIEKMKTWST